ncbi:hypothetical protein [Roseospira navarrensis]|uniref:Uncharacterized protein n=1 Tax=Roseospira navarrensis TaxID=140058 RepID=A0A7X1ZHL5_9PROT|nr:hypothetical protein [Roseospira navarrensis]MQX38134.1 hypothetical protein [Roseospira navarrensis]
MFITLFITACLAALVAGVILLIAKALGRRPPKALIPAAIGLAVLLFVTYSRYNWSDQMIERLPETVEVIERYRDSAFYEPWTYLWPRVTHFAVVDTATLVAHRTHPGLYLVEMILVGEGDPTLTVPLVVDCIRGRRATLNPNAPLDPAVLTGQLEWRTGRDPARLFEIVCLD